jgi:hypothetical protein
MELTVVIARYYIKGERYAGGSEGCHRVEEPLELTYSDGYDDCIGYGEYQIQLFLRHCHVR